MKKIVLSSIIIILVIIAGVFYYNSMKSSQTKQNEIVESNIPNEENNPAPSLDQEAQTHKIDIENFAFSPQALTINTGDSVEWTNNDDTSHTTTDIEGKFDSKTLGSGDSFTFTFTNSGTYSYFCKFHPGMKGTIIVQ